MKKTQNREQYLRYQRRRLRRVLRHRRRKASKKSAFFAGVPAQQVAYRALPRANVPWNYTRVVAPSVLSIVDNPVESSAFFSQLVANYRAKQRSFVYLKDVERIGYDAIVVLLSIMIRYKAAKIQFSGDFPEDRAANAVLKNSGFFEALYHEEFVEQDRYTVRSKNTIRTHADKEVDPELTATLIAGATKTIWKKEGRSQGVQRVLLELMLNTNNHASLRGQGEKHWWLTVNHFPVSNKVLFSFVDFGVGIFRSLDHKPVGTKFSRWREKLGQWLDGKPNADVLTQILSGEFHRRVAGEEFRGKGLPGIAQAFKRGWLSNLAIITNDVYIHLGRNEVITLKNPFDGTLVSWEMQVANRHTE
jgi:hypothetical protein